MPALLRSVDIVALPSYREGLPKGLIEAAASGCALVTTDVPGCREVVTHDVDGLLVPVRDAVALASAIERLVASPGLCRDMGVAGRRLAESAFDLTTVVSAHLNLYEEMAPTS